MPWKKLTPGARFSAEADPGYTCLDICREFSPASKQLRTLQINTSLERSISPERLGRYLSEKRDLDQALALYERNTRLAEALYTSLQNMEVCLRNTIHREMSTAYGTDWLTNGVPPLKNHSLSMIAEGLSQLSTNASSIGSLIAELKFAFWVGLLARRYDATLWRTALHACFPNAQPRRRGEIYDRFNAIRRFRKRVAHHEPIYDKCDKLHPEIIEAIGWMCVDTQAWTSHNCRFTEVFDGS